MSTVSDCGRNVSRVVKSAAVEAHVSPARLVHPSNGRGRPKKKDMRRETRSVKVPMFSQRVDAANSRRDAEGRTGNRVTEVGGGADGDRGEREDKGSHGGAPGRLSG